MGDHGIVGKQLILKKVTHELILVGVAVPVFHLHTTSLSVVRPFFQSSVHTKVWERVVTCTGPQIVLNFFI